MKYYITKTHNPYINTAMEEYLVKHVNEPVLFLYRNEKSITIPKNAKVAEEVNVAEAVQDGVQVVRRITGGPAIYLDEGVLNYAFIIPNGTEYYGKMGTLLKGFVDVYNEDLDLPVSFTEPNDLTIGYKQISGSSQTLFENKLLQHGGIYYNLEIVALNKYLKKRSYQLNPNGLDNPDQRLTNVNDFYDESYTPSFMEVKNLFIQKVADEPYEFTEDQMEVINNIAQSIEVSVKYVIELDKDFDHENVEYIKDVGTLEVYSSVADGKFTKFEIYLNHETREDVGEFADAMIGKEFNEEVVENFIESIANFNELFGETPKDELIKMIMNK